MVTFSKLKIPIVLIGIFILACDGNKNTTKSNEKITHHDQSSKDTQHENPSNQHMHQTPVAELIKRFESPERDAYQKPEAVINYLGDLQGKTIMDIGAGSGYFSVRLVDKAEKVIAADVNQEFLDHIEGRVRQNNIQNIEVRKIPFDSPALADGEVDMVLIVNTYHHIENRTDYFSKVRQGLKTGGEVVIIDFFKIEVPVGPKVDHKFSIDEVVSELKISGFKSFKIDVNSLPYQYIIKVK